LPQTDAWLLLNQKWIQGPNLAVGSYGGCFSKSSWTKEEYILIGGNNKPDHQLSNATLQHFSNGTWTLLADQTLSKFVIPLLLLILMCLMCFNVQQT